jgi:excisionase family DNA binding protein
MSHRKVLERPRVLLGVEEAAEALAISRTSMYGLLKADVIESVKLGDRRFVPADVIVAYVARLVEGQLAATFRQPEGN